MDCQVKTRLHGNKPKELYDQKGFDTFMGAMTNEIQ